ncbi:MAG: hypothetical protein AAF351_13115 [Pseudomonadota bacterium]
MVGSGGAQTRTRIPKGVPEYKNQPLATAPGLLRVVSGLSIFSIVGVLIYAIAVALTGHGSYETFEEPAVLLYIVTLHFILPLGVAYTITMNSAASRSLITVYVITLGAATVTGKGVLGALAMETPLIALAAVVVPFLVLMWLFRAPSMRIYYAIIRNRPVPADLIDRAEELANKSWINPRAKAAIDWAADHLETVVLLGFTALAVYALVAMGG